MKTGYYAKPLNQYIIEPLTNGSTAFWEGHHATNPSAIRLSSDPRVFLGYRAGGLSDGYKFGTIQVWSSHLGLAVLNAEGSRVDVRLPLPIMTIERDYTLPQTPEEYEQFKAGPHDGKISVLHDFRLWEDNGWLYCIFHEGALETCFDCIVRMPVNEFLKKMNRSIELAGQPIEIIRDEWRSLWWADGVWQPCGINGTNRIYGSQINKNDIVFMRLKDNSLRMIHRPIPDNSIIDTQGMPFCPVTEDGILTIGTVQQSIRPGMRDNSHIGNNGMPSRAKIGDRDVYIDVVHGVHNHRITDLTDGGGWDLEYMAYLRVLDYETGEQLYYSDGPIFESDAQWKAYSREGAWVSKLDHLRSVMFVGGQAPANPAKTGLDDKWFAYVGVGDTAVALAEFTLRDLLPPAVIDDLQNRVDDEDKPLPVSENMQLLGKVEGWEFSIRNNSKSRRIEIVRTLKSTGEQGVRSIQLRPGYIDAYAMWIESGAVSFDEKLGWLVKTKLQRSEKSPAVDGILLLDIENPERIFYRSDVAGTELPEIVKKETGYIYQYQPMAREVIKWLAQKASAVSVPAR